MVPLTTRRSSRPVRVLLTAAAISLAVVVQACGAATAHSSINDKFFGMHVPDYTAGFPTALSGTVGAVDLTSNQVYWPDLEPSQGTWTLDHLTTLVDEARANGAQPLLVLGGTPAWAASGGQAASRASVPDLDAWRTYVRKVVNTYGTRVDYEIWPEPNIRSNWAGSSAALAKLVASASKIIHSAQPDATVVAPAMVLRMGYQRTFMDKFFAQKVGGKHIGRYVDAVGLDLYPVQSGTPEDSMAVLAKARGILRAHKVSAPVWNVEINYGVAGAGQTTKPYGGAKQASYVARTYVLNAAAHVKRVYWLGWATYTTMAIALASDDGTPTRAGQAFLTVATWLHKSTAHRCTRDQKHHLYTCRLSASGRSSWVYWTTRGQTVVRAPKGSRQWSTISGDVHSTRAGKRLTVTTSPIRVSH